MKFKCKRSPRVISPIQNGPRNLQQRADRTINAVRVTIHRFFGMYHQVKWWSNRKHPEPKDSIVAEG